MDSWPSGLPQDLLLGASIADDDSVVRTAMDSGPSSTRNRFTAITQSVTVPILLTGSQLAIFNTFRRTTLQYGSLPFQWKHPQTDETVIYKFKKPPEWKSVKSGSVNDRLWQAVLEIEVQPS